MCRARTVAGRRAAFLGPLLDCYNLACTTPQPVPWAAVVLAILAFLALRPGKGWLRRRRAGGAKSTADKEARLDGKLLNAMPQQLAPAQPPFSVGVVSSGDTHGQFSPVPVPASYLTTAGVGHGDGTAR